MRCCQQETMALYNKAGANPMSGCLPALLQLPVFYALFSFFPVAFAYAKKASCGQMIYRLMIRFMSCLLTFRFMATTSVFSRSWRLWPSSFTPWWPWDSSRHPSSPVCPTWNSSCTLCPWWCCFSLTTTPVDWVCTILFPTFLLWYWCWSSRTLSLARKRFLHKSRKTRRSPKRQEDSQHVFKSDGRGRETTTR